MPARSAPWCGRGDSNPHDLHRWNLNPVRLPIPPRPPLPWKGHSSPRTAFLTTPDPDNIVRHDELESSLGIEAAAGTRDMITRRATSCGSRPRRPPVLLRDK